MGKMDILFTDEIRKAVSEGNFMFLAMFLISITQTNYPEQFGGISLNPGQEGGAIAGSQYSDCLLSAHTA